MITQRRLEQMLAQEGECAAARARAEVLEDENRRLEVQNEMLQQEVRRLTDTIIQMRREGFHPSLTLLDAPEEQPDPLDPDIERAIDSIAGDDPKLRQRLVEDAIQMRDKQDLPVNQIISLTLRGGAYPEESWQHQDSDSTEE